MRYMITHSLLSSWLYLMRENPYEDATTETNPMEDFMQVLRREPTETTEAMQKGIDFEDLVTALCTDGPRKEGTEKWLEAAGKVADYVRHGQLQYKASTVVSVAGMDILLYGRLDALKAGTIYDIKFSGSYERGKFLTSTQHPMYLYLIPEAKRFVYLISNGTDVWTEIYERDETPDIIPIIEDFFIWLDSMGLMETYRKYWKAA